MLTGSFQKPKLNIFQLGFWRAAHELTHEAVLNQHRTGAKTTANFYQGSIVTLGLCYVTIVGDARRSSASNSRCIAGYLLTYSSLFASCHDV